MATREDVTLYLNELARGDAQAAEKLWPLVYEELRRLAGHYFQDEPGDHTLQPTALVHEAFVRLVGRETGDWQSRAQFFNLAAQAMRHILIDHARRRRAAKRGGQRRRLPLEDGLESGERDDDYVIALDEALQRLAEFDGQLARIVELRFFGGMTFEEAAGVLGVAPITVKRLWKMAKGWLHREISKGE